MIHSSVEYGWKGRVLQSVGNSNCGSSKQCNNHATSSANTQSCSNTTRFFSEEERHDGYHENTNHGEPVQKEVPDCIAEVIHQNIPT